MDYSKICEDAIVASKAINPDANRFQHERAGRAAARAVMENEIFGDNKPNQVTLDLIWDKAWEDGHSSGLHEVAMVYDDLADIVKASRELP